MSHDVFRASMAIHSVLYGLKQNRRMDLVDEHINQKASNFRQTKVSRANPPSLPSTLPQDEDTIQYNTLSTRTSSQGAASSTSESSEANHTSSTCKMLIPQSSKSQPRSSTFSATATNSSHQPTYRHWSEISQAYSSYFCCPPSLALEGNHNLRRKNGRLRYVEKATSAKISATYKAPLKVDWLGRALQVAWKPVFIYAESSLRRRAPDINGS